MGATETQRGSSFGKPKNECGSVTLVGGSDACMAQNPGLAALRPELYSATPSGGSFPDGWPSSPWQNCGTGVSPVVFTIKKGVFKPLFSLSPRAARSCEPGGTITAACVVRLIARSHQPQTHDMSATGPVQSGSHYSGTHSSALTNGWMSSVSTTSSSFRLPSQGSQSG